MGRTSDEEGESSTQACELEDSDERPLKKARYIWQIKGKYHLKKPGDEEKDIMKNSLSGSTSPISEIDGFTTEVECPKSHLEENKNESVSTPIVEETVKSIEQESEVVSLGATYEVQQLADAFSSWELKKWQDRQIARSFVDNTINRVIEVMGFVPLPFDADGIYDDEELSIPNIENEDDDIEDEAVLMAIHSHGLQRSEQEEQQPALERCCNENKMSIPVVPCICNQQTPASVENRTPYPFHQRPVLSHIGDLEQPCQSSRRPEPVLPVNTTTNSILNLYPSSDTVPNYIENPTFSTSEEVLIEKSLETSVLKKTPVKCVNVSSSTDSKAAPTKDDVSSSYFEHNDFLDQAVGVAIQKKGLSTLSCLEFG